jgi:hypothetical protein
LCDARHIQSHCVQNLLRRDSTESSSRIKHLICVLVPGPEQKSSPWPA